MQHGRSLVDDDFAIPSEVDTFWTTLRAKVIPSVKKRPAVTIEARLSEPPEIRRQIEQQARAELIKAGADDKGTSVTVLSAYKQGYSWLVRRRAAGARRQERSTQITIKFAEIGAAVRLDAAGHVRAEPLAARDLSDRRNPGAELKIDLKKIHFEKAPIGSPAYEVIATADNGTELLRRRLRAKVRRTAVLRSFPGLRARARHDRMDQGRRRPVRTVADERIETDPERFWDHFQSKTLPALYDHVMALSNGKPRPEDAPFFGELTVDLTLSEPDYRLPIDQEQISSMEALHEEIYFNTIHFFDVMGRFTRGAGLTYPGRIIPVMHPKADGKPGRAKISITGFDAPAAIRRRRLHRAQRPQGRGAARYPEDRRRSSADAGATVRAGQDGVDRLDLRLKVDTEKDERDALVKRTDEARVDRTMISAEQANAVFTNLGRLHDCAASIATRCHITISATFGSPSAGSTRASRAPRSSPTLDSNGVPAAFPKLRNTSAMAGPEVRDRMQSPAVRPGRRVLRSNGTRRFHRRGVRDPREDVVVQGSDRLQGRPELSRQRRLGDGPDAADRGIALVAGQADDDEADGGLFGAAARERGVVHEPCTEDGGAAADRPVYREKLNKVNVVIHPITNADGAQLAYDLQKITPNFMLHAGYLGPLGVDVVAAQWDPDPLYPDSGIRPKIWRTWLPDIFLNPHGYPSHEWVQMFSEYAAWVRTRSVETRDYWTMRGWWMPGFAWLDDPRYPRHKDEQMKLLDMITDYAKAAPGTVALNERAYDRYKRYSFDFDQKNFKLDFTNGVLIYKSIKGARATPTSQDFMSRQPNVTIWDGTTEAPDETARGDWMKLVANAGLQWDKAVLDYLVQGHHEVERKVDALLERRQPDDEPSASAEAESKSRLDGAGERADGSASAGSGGVALAVQWATRRKRALRADGPPYRAGGPVCVPADVRVRMRVDINSDVGESFGAYTIGHDAGLMTSITSANVAAGFHAGDPSVLRATIRLAKQHGVAVGAHPGFPDLVGFGRRELNVTPPEAEDFVLYQIAAVAGVAAAEGVRLQHVKPHGALFNMAVRNVGLAGAIANAVAAVRPVADSVRPARFGDPQRPAAPPAFESRPKCLPIAPTSPTARWRRAASPARSSTIPPPSSRAPCGW